MDVPAFKWTQQMQTAFHTELQTQAHPRRRFKSHLQKRMSQEKTFKEDHFKQLSDPSQEV